MLLCAALPSATVSLHSECASAADSASAPTADSAAACISTVSFSSVPAAVSARCWLCPWSCYCVCPCCRLCCCWLCPGPGAVCAPDVVSIDATQLQPPWSSQCLGFEHDAHDYCSNASVATWILRPVADFKSASVPDASKPLKNAVAMHASWLSEDAVLVSSRHTEVALLLSLSPLSTLICRERTFYALPLLLLPLLLLKVCCRERGSQALPEVALSLLLLCLLLPIRCRVHPEGVIPLPLPLIMRC